VQSYALTRKEEGVVVVVVVAVVASVTGPEKSTLPKLSYIEPGQRSPYNVTRLRDGQSAVRMPVEAKHFLFNG
jgi:1,2-phenylacetyl-CoA epoxidase PaaB subunit